MAEKGKLQMTPLSVLASKVFKRGSKKAKVPEENCNFSLKCPLKVLEFCLSEIVRTMSWALQSGFVCQDDFQ